MTSLVEKYGVTLGEKLTASNKEWELYKLESKLQELVNVNGSEKLPFLPSNIGTASNCNPILISFCLRFEIASSTILVGTLLDITISASTMTVSTSAALA